MSPSRPPKTRAEPTPSAAASAEQGREVSRKKEEEGRLPPDGKRRKAAQAQDAALKRPEHPAQEEALDPKDAQKVPEHREPGPADPAARGRDAPVDVR